LEGWPGSLECKERVWMHTFSVVLQDFLHFTIERSHMALYDLLKPYIKAYTLY
jgi:hypothetical protein